MLLTMFSLSVDSSWFDFPMLLLCNLKNNGHGGFALSGRDLVSKFQPVSSSAATPLLKPSCIGRSLKIFGEYTSVRSANKELVLERDW